MSEIQVQVVPYQIDYQCDNCHIENLVLENMPLVAIAGHYQYYCPNCQGRLILDKIYPTIIYKQLT